MRDLFRRPSRWLKRRPILSVLLLMFSIPVGYLIYICSPHGYARLKKLESELNSKITVGTTTENARSILMSEGIGFREWTADISDEIFSSGDVKIDAHRGDHVLNGTVDNIAWQFPCTTGLVIILVFGPDGRARYSYIHRFYTCP